MKFEFQGRKTSYFRRSMSQILHAVLTCTGHIYPKKLFLVHLRFIFNWVACILSGNPRHFSNLSSHCLFCVSHVCTLSSSNHAAVVCYISGFGGNHITSTYILKKFPFLESEPTYDISKNTVQVILCLFWAHGFRSPGVAAFALSTHVRILTTLLERLQGEALWRQRERERPWNYMKGNQGKQPTARTKAKRIF